MHRLLYWHTARQDQGRHLRELIRLLGKEDKQRGRIQPDDSDGIIPRSFRYIWQQIMTRREKVYVKASFLEIYNEQIVDLLSDDGRNLPCRWNQESVS